MGIRSKFRDSDREYCVAALNVVLSDSQDAASRLGAWGRLCTAVWDVCGYPSGRGRLRLGVYCGEWRSIAVSALRLVVSGLSSAETRERAWGILELVVLDREGGSVPELEVSGRVWAAGRAAGEMFEFGGRRWVVFGGRESLWIQDVGGRPSRSAHFYGPECRAWDDRLNGASDGSVRWIVGPLVPGAEVGKSPESPEAVGSKPLTGWAWVESLPVGTRFYDPRTGTILFVGTELGGKVIRSVDSYDYCSSGVVWSASMVCRLQLGEPSTHAHQQWLATLGEESCGPERPRESGGGPAESGVVESAD